MKGFFFNVKVFLTPSPSLSHSLCPLIFWPAAVIGKSALDCCAFPFALIGFTLADWESAYIKASEKKRSDQIDLTTEGDYLRFEIERRFQGEKQKL